MLFPACGYWFSHSGLSDSCVCACVCVCVCVCACVWVCGCVCVCVCVSVCVCVCCVCCVCVCICVCVHAYVHCRCVCLCMSGVGVGMWVLCVDGMHVHVKCVMLPFDCFEGCVLLGTSYYTHTLHYLSLLLHIACFFGLQG